ncbi:MAG TPA: hypothetical protein VFK43_18230 [Acidimicrobiales bacterium]|nr:hypothetical protein [Acidimicrobiales bacterium]
MTSPEPATAIETRVGLRGVWWPVEPGAAVGAPGRTAPEALVPGH